MQPESQPPAPAVVAVVVTCDPGPWFEQVLASLAAQDYPNLSVLFIDSGSLGDPTEMIARVMPGAFIGRTGKRTGFGTAANEVLAMVEGASHLLICHDDVALAPDAVRLLVEEAFRSNSGIATPKFVQWEDPERLLAVGANADKVGVPQSIVEPGELDQQQHDSVREVLYAPTGATLIRADLFAVLGGFDEVVDQFGEDLNLSLRARVAGARVTVVPEARVSHYQATERGERPGWISQSARRRAADLTEAHRVRTLATCYQWFNLLWILPLALGWSVGEAATRVAQGRLREAWHIMAAFAAAWSRPSQLWRARRRVQRHRRVADSEIRRLQVRGNARLRSFVRSRVDEVRVGIPDDALPARLGRTGYEDEDELSPVGVPSATTAAVGASSKIRFTLIVAAVILAVLALGSRDLLGHEIPAVAGVPNTSAGWGTLWRSWWATWQPSGLGVQAASSPALALLGLLATVLLGAVGTLQHVVVLGPLIVGPLGAYRSARWWGSRRGRVAALVAYAVVPLPYNALARGHWAGLLAYAAAPWVLSAIGRLSGEVPYPLTDVTQVMTRVVGVGVLVAVVGSVAPSFLYVVPVMGLALVAGSALSGRVSRGWRMLAISTAATAVAIVLLFPWSTEVLGSRASVLGPAAGPGGRLGLGEVLRFHTGPIGKGPLGWAFLVVAALPLFIGRGWRLAWAARLWTVALVSFAWAWAGGRGWLPALPIEVVLAPAAAALAGSAALGAAAFELDLPGYRFGWRQLAAATAGAALVVTAIPWAIASTDGRWHMPNSDAGSSLSAIFPDSRGGDYRVLWVGAPDALPLAGRQLHPGSAYATSFDGPPGLADQWVPARAGATPQLAADLRLVEDRLTTKLGHLLAPTGVRYVVIPNHNGPSGSGAFSTPVPAAVVAGLALQTDMQLLNLGDPNYLVFADSAWVPARAVLPQQAVAASGGATIQSERALQQVDLSGAKAVLTGGGPAGVRGPVPAGSTIFVAQTRSSSWRLHVAGADLRPTPAFGWATSYAVPAASGTAASGSATPGAATAGSATAGLATGVPARLGYRSSAWSRLGQLLEIAFWAAAVSLLLVDARRRGSDSSPSEVVDPEWFTPMAPAVANRSKWRRTTDDPNDFTGDEAWIDV